MRIFGGEKYSKEAYEDAAHQTRGMADKMEAKGQAEANALHAEYNRLLAEAQEAIQAVADFEREKLGMHKEGAEEADTDKK